MGYDLGGRTVVITGAASGIGAALARRLADKGATLRLIDRNADQLAAIAKELGNRVASHHVADVADKEFVAALPGEMADIDGKTRVDVLINNAGIAAMGRFDELELDEFERVLDINLHGVIRMTKAFLPCLQPQARIVNLSSLFGLIGPPGQVPYVTSKFGVRGFSDALRSELHPTGIKVVCVHPGGIRTSIATNAHIAGSIGRDDAQSATDAFGKFLKLSPDRAAQLIIRATEKGSPRLVIGSDAKFGDLLSRSMPVGYSSVLRALMGKMHRHVGSMPAPGRS